MFGINKIRNKQKKGEERLDLRVFIIRVKLPLGKWLVYNIIYKILFFKVIRSGDY